MVVDASLQLWHCVVMMLLANPCLVVVILWNSRIDRGFVATN